MINNIYKYEYHYIILTKTKETNESKNSDPHHRSSDPPHDNDPNKWEYHGEDHESISNMT